MGVTRVVQPRGGFLSSAPPPAPRPPRVTKIARHQAAVRASLAEGPRTMREIVAASSLTMDQVNTALYTMRRAGVVEVAGTRPRPDGGKAYGRQHEALYRLVVR